MERSIKFILVPDKFKGSLPANQVREAVAIGIKKNLPYASIENFAASDGGDGFLEAIGSTEMLEPVECNTFDPLGRPITASYLRDSRKNYAYVEMAKASGLELLAQPERNPLNTSSFGTGILIRDAFEKGSKSVFIGLGGSATNDGGIGIASAFGYIFTDADGNILEPIGANLIKIARIQKPKYLPELNQIQFIAVNDVENPLYGPKGAAYTYGPQKGADKTAIIDLDSGLRQLDKIAIRDLGIDASTFTGSGAAGGAAYGLKVFLNAEFAGGAEFVMDYLGLKAAVRKSRPDLIITGEGKIDEQTLCGKFIQGILKFGKETGIPVAAVCGRCTLTKAEIEQAGFRWVLEISNSDKPLEWNLEHAFELTVKAATQKFKKL